jgi:hypothetical protein
MADKREILLYPGSPKTGTSALQAVLRCNVAELKAAGWNYLHDPLEGDPTALGSGNGLPLVVGLMGLSDEFDPLEVFERLAPPGERSIISCEAFSDVSPDEWAPIIDLLEAEGSTIHSVYCVRDVYPFIWSAHAQVSTGFKETSTFSSYVKATHMTLWGGRPILDRYSRQLPDSPGVTSETFLHYETIRANLIEELFLAGGLPLEAFDLDAVSTLDRPANRTLTQPEIALMHKINAESDHFRSQWSGNNLTKRPSPRPARPVWVPEVYEWLVEHAQPTLDEFNALLPAGTEWKVQVLDRSKYELEELDPHPDKSPGFVDAIYYLLSFEPAEDYRELLISLLPGGVYDPPPPPGRMRRVAGRAKRALTPS